MNILYPLNLPEIDYLLNLIESLLGPRKIYIQLNVNAHRFFTGNNFNFFLRKNHMNINKLFIIFWCLTSLASTVSGNIITIRNTEEKDFEEIQALTIKTFSHVYGFTSQEKIYGMKVLYAIFAEEAEALRKSNNNNLISFVAECENKIIGFFSAQVTHAPDEAYGRFIAVDPLFQKQGVMAKMLGTGFALWPSIKRAVCLTKQTNTAAQSLYESFGGKKVLNPSWIGNLYKSLNASDYIGYEFDEAAITALKSRFATDIQKIALPKKSTPNE
jgi:ribosomal protein S18 acetylase RimI-like enzyme